MSNEERRNELYGLLGDLPDRGRDISAKLIDSQEKDGFILEKLVLDLNGLEEVPAYFAKPKGAVGKLPLVVFNHSHGGKYKLGKDEFLNGNSYLPPPSYAKELTDLSFAAIAIDAWLFGERSGRTESSLFKEMLWKGKVLWGAMMYDTIRAVDYCISREDVDAKRIGTIGMSMGSTAAWWLAALDERIKVCVDICCLTDFESLIKHNSLDCHGIFYYVPSLLKRFDTADINELIAPRAHLSLAGSQDELTPVDGLQKIDNRLKEAYSNLNAKDNWRLSIYDVPHFENESMRGEAIQFLSEKL